MLLFVATTLCVYICKEHLKWAYVLQKGGHLETIQRALAQGCEGR